MVTLAKVHALSTPLTNLKEKSRSNSILRMLKRRQKANFIARNIRDYIKEFIDLILEISDMFDKDSLFFFMDGLQL